VPPLLAKAIAQNLMVQSRIEKEIHYACSR
jgi:hypothetical protein